MNITDSKIKFMKDGNIYTLLQKDEDSKVKFNYKKTTINIATKEDVLENLPNISYLDTIKIYYYLNGECIQLAVKEDVEYPNVYSLEFNNENEFENTQSVAMFRSFASVRSLNVEKVSDTITYNNTNKDLVFDDKIYEAYEKGIILQTRATDQVSSVIKLTNETEIETNNTFQDPLLGITIDTINLDVTRQVYNLTKGANGDESTFNNAASQTYFSGLSYTEVEG